MNRIIAAICAILLLAPWSLAQAAESADTAIVLMPEHPGLQMEACDAAAVDYSNITDGYIMACYTGSTQKRLKMRIQGPHTTYTYNLAVHQWTAFPLSDGNGEYQAAIYINTTDDKYAKVISATFNVVLSNEFAPFLRLNQYVDYASAPQTIAMGAQLCAGLTQPLEKVATVYDYVINNFQYDYEKAANVPSGYLPVLDVVLHEKKGICFDYAAVMTAMLRSQGIPCKLVVGYAGSIYHAWISVWTEEHGWVDGLVFFDGKTWERMDPTFASSNDPSGKALNFIKNGCYTEKYLY